MRTLILKFSSNISRNISISIPKFVQVSINMSINLPTFHPRGGGGGDAKEGEEVTV
jgi:hypothetical protein